MKKLLFVFLVLISISSFAQSTLKSQYNLTEDTVVNTATKFLTLGGATVASAGEKSSTVQVVFDAVEISGTTGGTATPQASIDGVNWYNVGTAYTLTDVASQVSAWTLTGFPHKYLRIAVAGAGTMSDKIHAKVLIKQ